MLKKTKLIRSLFWDYLHLFQDHKDFLHILLFLVLLSKWVPEIENITKIFMLVILSSSFFSLLKLETKKWIWIYKCDNVYPLPILPASRSNKRKVFTSQLCLGQALLNFCFVYMSFDRKISLQNLATFQIFSVYLTTYIVQKSKS